MTHQKRSGCPINLAVEAVGDKWSLIIIRDMMFGRRRTYRELLTESLEGISTNILADRLRSLMAAGILTRSDDPAHRQKGIYSLTERGIDLLPVLLHLGAWGRKYLPARPEFSIRAELLERGGPEMWEALEDELRAEHLGSPRKSTRSVAAELQDAYEEAVRRQKRGGRHPQATKASKRRRRGL